MNEIYWTVEPWCKITLNRKYKKWKKQYFLKKKFMIYKIIGNLFNYKLIIKIENWEKKYFLWFENENLYEADVIADIYLDKKQYQICAQMAIFDI